MIAEIEMDAMREDIVAIGAKRRDERPGIYRGCMWYQRWRWSTGMQMTALATPITLEALDGLTS